MTTPRAPAGPPSQLYRLAWAFYLALASAGVVWIGLERGTIPLSLFVAARNVWLDLALGVGAALLLLALWALGERYLRQARRLRTRLAAIVVPLKQSEIVGLAVLSGFAEELFFRGAVQGAWGFWWATLLFAALHTGPGTELRLWTLLAALAGLLFGGLVLWRGNLLAAVLAHALFNGVSLSRVKATASSKATAG